MKIVIVLIFIHNFQVLLASAKPSTSSPEATRALQDELSDLGRSGKEDVAARIGAAVRAVILAHCKFDSSFPVPDTGNSDGEDTLLNDLRDLNTAGEGDRVGRIVKAAVDIIISCDKPGGRRLGLIPGTAAYLVNKLRELITDPAAKHPGIVYPPPVYPPPVYPPPVYPPHGYPPLPYLRRNDDEMELEDEAPEISSHSSSVIGSRREFTRNDLYPLVQYPPMIFRRTDEDQMRLGDNWDSEPPENSPHSSLVMGSRRGMALNVLQNLLDGVTKGLNGVANILDGGYKGPGAYPYHPHP